MTAAPVYIRAHVRVVYKIYIFIHIRETDTRARIRTRARERHLGEVREREEGTRRG